MDIYTKNMNRFFRSIPISKALTCLYKMNYRFYDSIIFNDKLNEINLVNNTHFSKYYNFDIS